MSRAKLAVWSWSDLEQKVRTGGAGPGEGRLPEEKGRSGDAQYNWVYTTLNGHNSGENNGSCHGIAREFLFLSGGQFMKGRSSSYILSGHFDNQIVFTKCFPHLENK